MTEERTNPFDFTLLYYAAAWIAELQHLFQLDHLIQGTPSRQGFRAQLQHFVPPAAGQHLCYLIPAQAFPSDCPECPQELWAVQDGQV